jgi:hypothetical protein
MTNEYLGSENSRISRRQLQLSPNNAHNPTVRLRGRTAGIHLHNALRFSCHNRLVALLHAGEKGSVLLFEPVFVRMMFGRVLV